MTMRAKSRLRHRSPRWTQSAATRPSASLVRSSPGALLLHGSLRRAEAAWGATLAGGLALLTNNVTGPGVAALPLVFVSAGWLPSLLLLIILLLASGTASQLLCDAIRALPGNADYGRRVELLSATQELLPYWAYCAAFVTFIAR